MLEDEHQQIVDYVQNPENLHRARMVAGTRSSNQEMVRVELELRRIAAGMLNRSLQGVQRQLEDELSSSLNKMLNAFKMTKFS